MKNSSKNSVCIDNGGKIILPKQIASDYGLIPGDGTYSYKNKNALHLDRPVRFLGKVYIEPTNRCNLECFTCIRNVWNEPLGNMNKSTFNSIIEGLKNFSPAPDIFFGGLGEPLMHPDIVKMVGHAKTISSNVELITNGTLLTGELSRQLIAAGLDMLWVSIDGASPESYADVRLGAELTRVLANLAAFRDIRWSINYFKDKPGYSAYAKPKLGIVFVAMKHNIDDLPALLRLGSQFGVSYFMVTNVLPYTLEMCKETLFSKVLTEGSSPIRLELPRMDVSEITHGALYGTTQAGCSICFPEDIQNPTRDICPFIEHGATAISWEGNLSPCLPLLHSHLRFVEERKHFARRYVVGNLQNNTLEELWHDKDYIDFRRRVATFNFSPCSVCGGCDLAESNEADCIGNSFPTCGTCPWAQGVIKCP